MLDTGEQILLKDGIIGWNKTLCVTNQRLLFLNKDNIERAIQIDDILEVYPRSQSFTGLTQLVIKHKTGAEEAIVFKTGDKDLLFGGLNFAGSNATNMANRYVNLINRVMNDKI